jgi:hypothetical protein
LNVHFHMLIPDGVYLTDTDPPYLKAVCAPTRAELQALVQYTLLSHRANLTLSITSMTYCCQTAESVKFG